MNLTQQLGSPGGWVRKCKARRRYGRARIDNSNGPYRLSVECFTAEVEEADIQHCCSALLAKRLDEFHLLSDVWIGCRRKEYWRVNLGRRMGDQSGFKVREQGEFWAR